jgi:hypothetical protein
MFSICPFSKKLEYNTIVLYSVESSSVINSSPKQAFEMTVFNCRKIGVFIQLCFTFMNCGAFSNGILNLLE